jgi:hypothetical protein
MACISLDRRWAEIGLSAKWEDQMYVAETLWRRAAIVHQAVLLAELRG